ncbi:MAG TPA: nitric oxide synthase oxygenase, partial [Gemmatimonadetes bacterium]|nr:nitric oxide synthase oxygenase [Gemmatimonadota bacterium]
MRRPTNSQPSLLEEAEAFLSLTERELAPRLPAYDVRQRLSQVRSEIEQEGTYRHTEDELLFGAQVAWRNSNRCLGRLPWRSLQILDYRSKSSPESVFRSL